MNIAKAVKAAREAAQLTQEELAMNTILYLDRIKGIEEGHIEYDYLSTEEIASLAGAFNIPVELFIVLGIEEKDIAKGKKDIANTLLPSVTNLILDMIKSKG